MVELRDENTYTRRTDPEGEGGDVNRSRTSKKPRSTL